MLKKFLLSFILCFISISSAFALQVSETKVVKDLHAGQKDFISFTLDNPDERDIGIRIYSEDFTYKAPYDGAKEFFPLYTTDYSFGDTLDIQPKEFIIQAGSSANVTLAIEPKDDFDSVMAGVVFVEFSLGTTFDQNGNAIQVLNRIGVLVFAQPSNGAYDFTIENIEASSDKFLSFNILNSGKKYIMPKIDYYVMDSEGMILAQGDTPEHYLLPKDKANFEIALGNEAVGDNLTLLLNVTVSEETVLIREINFQRKADGTIKVLNISE